MAKQENWGTPVGDIPTKEIKDTYSNSLKRVYNNGTYEGIYLGNRQIIELGNQLKKMKKELDGPDGVCFMIGLSHIDEHQHKYRTVEIVPFKKERKKRMIFYKKDRIIGQLNEIDLGKPFEGGAVCKIDGDGFVHEEHNPDDGAIPNHIVGQHTPPPSPE